MTGRCPRWTGTGRMLGVSIAVLLLGGCNCATTYELFNATPAPVTVSACQQSITIEAGQLADIGSPASCGYLTISARQRMWRYAAPGDADFSAYSIEGPARRCQRIRLQLGADGMILAVRKNSPLPVGPDHPQPEGFPLRPLVVQLR